MPNPKVRHGILLYGARLRYMKCIATVFLSLLRDCVPPVLSLAAFPQCIVTFLPKYLTSPPPMNMLSKEMVEPETAFYLISFMLLLPVMVPERELNESLKSECYACTFFCVIFQFLKLLTFKYLLSMMFVQ